MEALLTAVTSHGTVLSLDLADRRICHLPPGGLGSRQTPLKLMTGGRMGERCLVFGVDPATHRPVLPRPVTHGSGLFLHARVAAEPNTLRSMANGRYLSAVPDNRIEADRAAAAAWEQFTLVADEAPPAQRSPELEHFLARVPALFGSTIAWADSIATLLADTPSDLNAALVEAVWPLLTLTEFDTLAGQLQHDRVLQARLSHLFHADFYATKALPALLQSIAAAERAAPTGRPWSGQAGSWPGALQWRARPLPPPRSQPAPAPDLLGPPLDHLARDGYDGSLSSFAHACNASLRDRVTPTRGVAVVATARSEGIYLLEWIAHYRLLGAEAIFLYTNNNDDGSDALLGALHAANVITWTRSEMAAGISAQNKAYGHALNVNLKILDHRWALFIDLDEFLVLNPARYGSVADFARWHEMRQTDAVGINWVMVGSSGQARWTEAPLSRRNTHLLNEPNAHIKVMLSPRHFIQAHPHFPFADYRRSFVFRLANGTVHEHRNQPRGNYHAQAFTDEPSSADACLYHYNFKSVEEFAWKVSRNRGDFPMSHDVTFAGLDAVAVGSFVEQHRSTGVTVAQPLGRGLEAEIDRLRSLPGVAQAERSIIDHFRQRVAGLKARLVSEPRLDLFGPAGQEMRALLRATL